MRKLIMFLAALLFSSTLFGAEITLTSDNMAILEGRISYGSIAKLQKRVREMDQQLKSGYPIYLFIYSGGGSISAGSQFIEFTRGLNRPVHAVAMWAGSMAFYITQHSAKRYVLGNGEIMAHKARGGFFGEFGDKNSSFDARYNHWLKKLLRLDDYVVSRTGGKFTVASFRKAYANELWLGGDDAVKAGLADEIATVRCDGSVPETYYQTFNFFGFEIRVHKDGCPVNRGRLSYEVLLHTNHGLMSYGEFKVKGGKFDDCRVSDEYDSGYSYHPSGGSSSGAATFKPKELCTIQEVKYEDIMKELGEIKKANRHTGRKVYGFEL